MTAVSCVIQQVGQARQKQMNEDKEPGGLRRELKDRRLPLVGVFIAACGLWAYWPTLGRIVDTWATDADYSHGYLVVPFSLLFLWLRRATRPITQPGFHPAGLLLLVLAGLSRHLAGRLYLPEVDAWSIPLWIGGVCWTILGWPTVRWALPSLAFLWFATPLPGTVAFAISTPLQKIAAQGSGIALQLMGQPAIVEGTTIELGNQTLEVETACSGLRMFYGITALALAIIVITRPGRWKTIGVLLTIVPVAIVVNVIRITSTGLLVTHFSSESAVRLIHSLAGVIAIPLAIFMFAGFLWFAGRVTRNWRNDPQRSTRSLFVGIATCIVLVLAGVWWYGVQRERAFTTLVAMADRCEKKGDWSTAANYLSRYTRARPDDTHQLVHLAETFTKQATTPATKLRAAELLRIAYNREPQRRDLALQAIDLATETQSFPMALELIADLQQAGGGSDDKLVDTRADVLLRYLNSPQGSRQTDYTWADVSTALEKAIARPDYSTQMAAALAVVTREYLIEPSQKERAARADKLMRRLVADRAADPEAWFARYCYAKQYWADDGSHRADVDLDEAVKRCGAASPDRQVEILLAAAVRSRRDRTLDVARDLLQRAIVAQPVDARPYLVLADIERRAHGPAGLQASIEVLRRGLKATNGRSLQLALSLAQALEEAGDEEEALQVLQPVREMLRQVGDEPLQKYLTIGIATVESIRQQRNSQPAEAARTLQAALASSDVALVAAGNDTGQIEQAWRRLGQLYNQLGRPDQAIEAYRQVLRVNPESPTDRQVLAETALLAGDTSTAIEENLRRVKSEPDSGDAWVALAIAQLQQQLRLPPASRNLSDVSRSLSRAWKLSAAKLPLMLASVDQLRAQSRWQEAQQLLEKSLHENAEQPQLWQALAVVQLDQSNHAAALKSAEEFAAHGGSVLGAAAFEANILAATGRGEDAVQRLKETQAKLDEREQLKATQMIATLESQLGHNAAAREVLEAAHQEHPSELGPVEQLASYAADDRDWPQLAKWEGKLRELEGDNGTLWKAYRATRLLADGQKLDREELTDVNQLVRQISAVRPRWATSQYLLAQIALRRGESDEAIRYLENTWQMGDRSSSVAEQLFSSLIEAGRKDDANRYIGELGDMPLVSPGLFDRVLPIFFQTGRSKQAVARARQWVEENPKDAQAYVRLGRTLLLYASTQSDRNERTAQLAASESAFRDALRLDPSELSAWTSLSAFLLQTQRPSDAAQLLERFDREAKFEPIAKELLLAKLNGAMRRPADAIKHWRRAVGPAAEKADTATRVAALSQAARYFAAVSPALAERYCRQALELDATAPEPAKLLAELLSSRDQAKALDEAVAIATQLSNRPGMQAVEARQLLARLLTERNAPGDANAVISLLEIEPVRDNDEKLLLATNYARIGREGAAYELLDDVASAPTPRVGDLAAYLKFWQENFQAEGRFTNRAQEVLERLGQLPQGPPEQLRWKIRLAQTAVNKGSAKKPTIASILAQFWISQPVAKLLESDQSSQSLLYGVLRMLLEEGRVDEAVELCRRPPGKIAPQFAARLLANTLMVHRLEDAPQVAAGEKLLDEELATNPHDVLLLQDAGDLAALSGNANRAEAMYKQVLAIDPRHRNATGNLATLLSDDPERRQEVLRIVDEALAERPSDGSLLNSKGQVLLKMDRAQEAIAVLAEAADNDPLSASAYLHLAMAHEQLGEDREVEESLLIAAGLGIDQEPMARADRQALAALLKKYNL